MNTTSTETFTLKVEQLDALDPQRRAALVGRGRDRLRELHEPVRQILEDVRTRGDAAALEYAARFDTVPASLRISEREMTDALARADADYVAALRLAASNIEHFHCAQLIPESPIETVPGARLWRLWRPIERVGIYTPGGGARYPSCLLMAAIPARVAGCQEIVVCTAPDSDGRVPDAILAAAALAGVTELYALSGPQAIAAMAFGTETIRPVDKIFGPGSSYVAAAKALVASEVAVDLPAGPSEILILADETANPEWLAADLLAQAEHGSESASLLVTTSVALAEATRAALACQLDQFSKAPQIAASLRANGALLTARTMDDAIDFVNAYAPEHLEIVTRDGTTLLSRVRQAGAVFLGSWSAVAAGDYASGGNHTLPTASYARGFGPLAIEAFGRKMQVQELQARGLRRLRRSIETLAAAEGLPAHAASIRVRFASDDAPDAGIAEPSPTSRSVEIRRVTRETDVSIELHLDAPAADRDQIAIATGVPFLDHLLTAFAFHGQLGLTLNASGDTDIDDHHSVEDVGLVLGQALRAALGERRGIRRFGHAYAPMDEALARAVVDISGRPYLAFEGRSVTLPERVGTFETQLVEEFWRAVAMEARLTLRLDLLHGRNGHHALEALFKAAGLALGDATRIDPLDTRVPSTKGVLA